MSYGYDFYFKIGSDVLIFPITPPELTYKQGSNNKTITLINEGDINILKSPSLFEIEFEARFPMRKYPYSREPRDINYYTDIFHELKTKKKHFRFIVTRGTLRGGNVMGTDKLVSLEDYTIKESADEGDDVLIEFKLKQWKPYGVVTIPNQTKAPDTTSTANVHQIVEDKATEVEKYTVKPGDTLWAIAKLKYGNGALYTKILNANKTGLDNEAKKHGKQSSSNGHWIYPNYVLTIPPK